MLRIWNLFWGQAGNNLLKTGLILKFGLDPVFAGDFFVRSSGEDSASGRTKTAAWRTIERVNREYLQPGTRVLFEAGQTFIGNLRLTEEDAGTANVQVTIGSFGNGRATLFAGVGTGVTVENAGGITLANLILVGAGTSSNTGCGIRCDNTLTNAVMLDHLAIENVEVSGFGKHGILVGGAPAGFRHVRVSHCVMRDNLCSGMEITGRLPWDKPGYAHEDVQVLECRAYDNCGDPNYHTSHSGSGIVLSQVDGGLIDRCVAWNNGALNGSVSGGPVGLWTCASRQVTIQHCESFGNRTTGADGGGFDIDGGSEDCVLQYNYSHDNDGPGLMVYTYPYETRPDRGNVMRFNISENDSRKSRSYAGLWVRNDGTGMTGVKVYNNTVIMGPWADQAASVHGEGVEACFWNNIFLAVGGGTPLRVEKSHGKIRFENNLYWQVGSPVQVKWDEKAFGTLEGWRKATGAESLEGKPLGMFENPRLIIQAEAVRAGQRVGVGNPEAFRPRRGSPAQTNGLNLHRKLVLDSVLKDFAGNRLPATGPWPIGAFAR